MTDTASLARINSAVAPLKALWLACDKDPNCPPFRVLEARRGRIAQEQAFSKGNSRAHFGQSPHNYDPPVALDVVPWPLDWNDIAAFKRLGAFAIAKATELDLPIGWGGSWPTFKDYPHYELLNWKDFVKKGGAKLYVGK